MRTALLLLALLVLPAPLFAGDEAPEPDEAEPTSEPISEPLPEPVPEPVPAPEPEPTPGPAIPTGLTGTWLVDNDASDPVDPLLKMLGRNELMRAMAKRIKTITHTIVVDEVGIEVLIEAGPRKETTRSEFDQMGSAFVLGDTYDVMTHVEAGAVVKTATLSVEGAPIDFHASRSLQDPDSMLLRFTLTPEGGETVQVSRIFRRVQEQ